MSTQQKTFLFVTQSQDHAERLQRNLPEGGNLRIEVEVANLTESATSLSDAAPLHDGLVLDLGSCGEADTAGLSAVLEAVSGAVPVLALADNAAPLARIRSVLDAGVADVIPDTAEGPALEAVLLKATRVDMPRLPEKSEAGLSVIFPVMSSKGGVGGTTVAANFACALAHPGQQRFKKGDERRVALLDFDLQFGDAHVFFDLEDNGGLLHLLEGDAMPDAHKVLSAMQVHESGVHILSAPQEMVPLASLTPAFVAELLNIVRAHFDYTLINLPRAFLDWTGPVLDKATSFVAVTDESVQGVRNTRRILDLLEDDYVGLPVHIVLNKHNDSILFSAGTKDVQAALGRDLDLVLPMSAAALAGAELGQPPVIHKPGDRLSKKVRKAAANLDETLSLDLQAEKVVSHV